MTRRAKRTRPATPQDDHAIPLQQVNVPVLNPEWIKSRLNPATLERLMQVWGLVGRLTFPPSSSGKACEGSRRIPTADARFLRKAGIIEDASSTVTGGWIMPLFGCGGENHRLTTTMDRVAARQEPRRPLQGECSSFAYFPLFAACDGRGRFLPGLKGVLFSCFFAAGDSASLSMPRGGRHAGGADTAPSGIQGRPRNSPDYYFGNCGGDDGGSPPLGCTSIGAYRTHGSVIYALQGRKATRHCGRPKCFVMRTVVTPR
ncbi:hypothetical protein C3747_9g385 [Trypanosoma cruzi]|uniref:Target of rapamycin (TOR) kinase 1 n=1 Tax=Trypanosoma cruzi TaxID=5693 RepID=A0A2V2XFH6_TRYCR|nr:hypothetical protein C3747_9g385 [Trypanosoma cruzi]